MALKLDMATNYRAKDLAENKTTNKFPYCPLLQFFFFFMFNDMDQSSTCHTKILWIIKKTTNRSPTCHV